MDSKIEYKVRPVTRYVVTRYQESLSGVTGSSQTKGEFDNHQAAFDVAYALCKDEHERLKLPVGSDLIKYPAPHSAMGCVVKSDLG
jgi:hypothetical protein